MRSTDPAAVHWPHRWTEEGVTVDGDFTGAHLLHASVAGCVLNDVYREAAELGIGIDGVRVTAGGDFDRRTWRSTGIEYTVELAADAPLAEVRRLLEVVDEVAEIPAALRAATTVRRVGR
nr:OsmC family protein [Blastococcus sp. PRF04-17]